MENDAAYLKAIAHRDGQEVENCSIHESMKRAEQLFLELAENGHVKAMHNYAMILYKRKEYNKSFEWFDKAGL